MSGTQLEAALRKTKGFVPYSVRHMLRRAQTRMGWPRVASHQPRAAEPVVAAPKSEADQRVSDMWSQTAALRQNAGQMGWLDSPLIQRHYVDPKFGRRDGDIWVQYLLTGHAWNRKGHWASLGCGGGGLECGLAQRNLFGSMDCFDISDGSLEIGRQTACRLNLPNMQFLPADLNRVELPKARYDVILMAMSLHHVAEIERLLTQVRHALKPGGLFMVNEYVGPTQLQHTPKTMQIMNELLQLLPEPLRVDCMTNQVRQRVEPRSREWWNQADPSEAVRSDRIVPALHEQFQILKQVNYGGTLLNPLLEYLVANFSAADPQAVCILRLLCYLEDVLIREGVMENAFAAYLMKV
ncbi:MAG: class I SAM-dependent methyltransferase [Gemmataceae bacterium]